MLFFFHQQSTDVDIEDIGKEVPDSTGIRPVVHSVKRKRDGREESPVKDAATWREALGPPPPFGTTKVM